jgi:Glycosyltransferase family 87
MSRAMSGPRSLGIRLLELSVCVVLPALTLAYVFKVVAGTGKSTDFETAFWGAAQAILHGDSPYPSLDDPVIARGLAYVYPPLTALATVPFTVLPRGTAGFLVVLLLTGLVALTLYVLGIRDWRCYGIAYAWPPVYSAIQTGNVTIPLALCVALAWRYRDRAVGSGVSVGVGLAVKLFVWPLSIWLAATRRYAAAAVSVLAGTILLALSWAAIGFDGLREYPDLLRRLEDILAPESYTVYALALDLGASSDLARVLWIAVGVGLVSGVVYFGRRRDDRRSFVLAIAATLACTPLVWLHYFALLLVAVAIAQPMLGVVWFVPFAMYLSTATHNGSTFQNALTIGTAALTLVIALRPARLPSRRVVTARTSPAGEPS